MSSPGPSARLPPRPADEQDRAKTIAALERLMMTGDPLHTDHGSGIWLQAAVEHAFARNDTQIMRLAQRAARPLLPHIRIPMFRSRRRILR